MKYWFVKTRKGNMKVRASLPRRALWVAFHYDKLSVGDDLRIVLRRVSKKEYDTSNFDEVSI